MWHFSLVLFFFVSQFLIFMEWWLLPESKSQALLSEKMVTVLSVIAETYLFQVWDTSLILYSKEKRNPDLRHLCHCRFVGTPYGSCKIVSGGWRITSMWWESKENLHMESIFGLPWAQNKSDFNFVNTKVGHFLDTCTVANSVGC